MKRLVYVFVAVAVILFGGYYQAEAVPIVGTPTFGGTVIDFEGWDEGTLIDTEYSSLGVTFTQDDGGTPMIDNKAFIYAYESGSGDAVLTGSTTGGAPYPTVAGLIAEFETPVARAGAFFSDTAPLGDYTVTAFDSLGGVIESYTITYGTLPSIPEFGNEDPSCDSDYPRDGTGCGIFVGFDVGSDLIASIQFGPSSVFADGFAIDDLRFERTAVPEPGTLLLIGSGLVGLGFMRRRFRG